MRKRINFGKKYDKLSKERFTTIRSPNFIQEKGLKIGDIVEITLNRELLFKAVIENFEIKPINRMELTLLKDDVAPEPCNSIDDFVKIMNKISIRYCGYGNNRATTRKTIIYLRRIK